MEANHLGDERSVETMTAELVFESFFDDASGEWSLRRVAAPPSAPKRLVRPRIRLRARTSG